MPDIQHQLAQLRHRMVSKAKRFSALNDACQILLMLLVLGLSGPVLADSTPIQDRAEAAKKADPNGYDIAIIIDNREIALTHSANEDLQAIKNMMDRHMFADHFITLQNPTLAVICDIFGGCPNEAKEVWPSLIKQVANRQKSRLFVYYLGPARIEGQERQWLFRSQNKTSPRPTESYAIGWLHRQLEKAAPRSALVLMETSFAPRPLPCNSEDPLLIDATMETVKRNYHALMKGRSLPEGHAELSATLPIQAPHCDRFELTSDGIERPLFTKYVLKGIVDGEADKEPFGDEDGAIDLGELAAYTNSRIKRAVQFQWGREQTVWQVGAYGHRLARVEPRASTLDVQKPDRPSKPANKPPPDKATKRVDKELKQEPKALCERNPEAKGCHVCEQNPGGDGCWDFCQTNPDSFHCALVCTDQEVSEACPCTENDPRSACNVSWCQWSAAELGPSTVDLLEMFDVRREEACRWATGEEEEDPNLFWQLFTPIIGRLLWPQIEPMATCTLNCNGLPARIGQSTSAEPTSPAETEPLSIEPSEPAEIISIATDQEIGVDEQRSSEPKTAFHLEVCDEFEEPLPPYIALPRWMPGTLMISEALRSIWGCQPPVITAEKTFKRAPYFARGLPPPTWTVPPRFSTPGPVPLPKFRRFAMPPPVALEGPTYPPFKPTVSQVRWLQSALTLGNFNPGPIDGSTGGQTDQALKRWRGANLEGNVIGSLTKPEFDKIIQEFGHLFDQIEPNASLY